jgi:hypothetical protein
MILSHAIYCCLKQIQYLHFRIQLELIALIRNLNLNSYFKFTGLHLMKMTRFLSSFDILCFTHIVNLNNSLLLSLHAMGFYLLLLYPLIIP